MIALGATEKQGRHATNGQLVAVGVVIAAGVCCLAST